MIWTLRNIMPKGRSGARWNFDNMTKSSIWQGISVMEMTLQRLGLGNVRQLVGGAVMPLGILALVAMMVLPLPVFLLDTFFVSNILVSLLILMVAMHTQRPLDFSSFQPAADRNCFAAWPQCCLHPHCFE